MIRQECLDHVIMLNEHHLGALVKSPGQSTLALEHVFLHICDVAGLAPTDIGELRGFVHGLLASKVIVADPADRWPIQLALISRSLSVMILSFVTGLT